MMLKLFESDKTRRVSAEEVRDYQTFGEHHHNPRTSQELQTFEKFYAARSLLERGLEVFLDPEIGREDGTEKIQVDACGTNNRFLTIFLCETTSTDPSITNALKLVSEADNARVVILAPTSFDTSTIETIASKAFDNGTVSFEHLGWFDQRFDETLQETLRLVDLLGNETRMRMLTPLFRRTSDKRDYRATINPKLVYKNLEVLLQARLLDENESGYELSELGKTVLAEFITFLEKTRKTLNTRTRSLGGEKPDE